MSVTPKHSGLLSVNGARYAKLDGNNLGTSSLVKTPSSALRMPYDAPGGRMAQQVGIQPTGGTYRTISAPGTAQIGISNNGNILLSPNTSGKESSPYVLSSPPPSNPITSVPQIIVASMIHNNEPAKYWKLPPTGHNASNRQEDIVVIHVCDENQQLSRDFCCKRDILVEHMKYFQKFLSENDGNGYEDIDISVHCDVEIFEWLMTFIHEPDTPPKIDKSIIVSILISSEFLQMDKLVDLCISQMTQNMNEIIKLPIDLSCISEKLINRIASITSPKTLSEIRDRKDKILSKLYKRRVELDFSRKGSTSKSSSGANVSSKTIAASLTCCRYCGSVYLETYGANLMCRKSPPSIDFRGRLVSRHAAIPNWSLTSYLKTLHSGGMGWDAIYWHVWAACIVVKNEEVVLSALEVDRYNVEPDGLLIKKHILKDSESSERDDNNSTSAATSISTFAAAPKSPRLKTHIEFSIDMEDDNADVTDPNAPSTYKMVISNFDDHHSSPNQSNPSGVTPTLNPLRPPDVLTSDIFDLICTQMKYIVGLQHKTLIHNTMQTMIQSSSIKVGASVTGGVEDFYDILWSNPFFGEVDAAGNTNDTIVAGTERRRGRSPGRGLRAASLEPRKTVASQGPAKLRSTSTAPTNNAGAGSDSDTNDVPNERRSRSSSMGKRNSIVNANNNSSSGTSKAATTLPTFSSGIADDNNDRLLVTQDPVIMKKMEVLRSLPPDLHHRVVYAKGPIHGVWILQNPLQIHPSSLDDMLQLVSESTTLSDHKKMEWNLDLMREYDEKRMDRLERFLATKRNILLDQAIPLTRNTKTPNIVPKTGNYTKNGPSGIRGVNVTDYYRDRGRQPYRIVN